MPTASLSVVIPTYRRPDTLHRVLASLLAQDPPGESFEIVVVDDGSPERADLTLLRPPESPLDDLRYVRQEHRGVSAARNRGVAEARGELVLFLQDDTVASPDLVSQHLRWHSLHPEVTGTVSGLVRWPPDWELDHFMGWLDKGGPQFRYHEIMDREIIDYKHFYTCNVSLKRQALVENPFDEAILYGFEDIELGFRLAQKGFTFYFNPDAVAYHYHRRSFADFERRQFAAGQSLFVALKRHPDLRGKTGITCIRPWKRFRSLLRGAAGPVAAWFGSHSMLEKYWKAKLDEALVRGYSEAVHRERLTDNAR